MSVINVLSPHVADMIAAGEVVERPASVVKELVENSFDAGAGKVSVEIRDGGSTFIRVSDNGCGMAPEDAGTAFLRHATSKLRDARGLEAIGTMGFRGEALAAISAVSQIELITRRAQDNEGTRVTLTAGDIIDMDSLGCPAGTVITVEKLFFNTPARQKFLKSDRSEASACQLAVTRAALSRPDVSVRFIRDGEEIFSSPGKGVLQETVYSVLGREMGLGMLDCSGENERAQVSGLISRPSDCRGNRGGQYFFCNGRVIKSAVLQTALEQAYKNSMLTGRYPACVLYIELPLGEVDVNVHPAKTEVKFANEKLVFDLVYYSVLSALDREKSGVTPKTAAEPHKSGDFYKQMTAAEFRSSVSGASAGNVSVHISSVTDAGSRSVLHSGTSVTAAVKSSSAGIFPANAAFESYQTSMDLNNVVTAAATPKAPEAPEAPEAASYTPEKDEVSTAQPQPEQQIVENPVQNVDNSPVPDHKIVGELFKKYIAVEVGDSCVLIDKHAAHERMIFDRLKARGVVSMSQSLLVPVPLHLNGDDSELLSSNLQLMGELGFEIDSLDAGDYVVRAVPADMYAEDVVPAVEEICEKLRNNTVISPADARDEILHTVACKAAIKAGWDTSLAELEALVVAVLSGRVLYCPHGRPVSFTVDSRELDKKFKRIV